MSWEKAFGIDPIEELTLGLSILPLSLRKKNLLSTGESETIGAAVYRFNDASVKHFLRSANFHYVRLNTTRMMHTAQWQKQQRQPPEPIWNRLFQHTQLNILNPRTHNQKKYGACVIRHLLSAVISVTHPRITS